MAFSRGPKIVTDGLVLALDAANPRSYPGSGTTWYDLSGNGYNGTLLNGTSFSNGNSGYLSFDGTNDRISFTQFTHTTAWTISYWFYHDGESDDMTIGEHSTNPNRFYHRDTGTSYKLRVHNNDNISVQDMALGDIRNQWAHLAYSMDDSSGTIKGWVNGEQVLDTSTGYSATFVVDSWGRVYPNDVYHWKGRVGPVLIYNRQITTPEYKQIYNATRSRFGL